MNDEEEVTAHILRLAGTAPAPSGERTARVRHAVQREWRAARHRRLLRRGAWSVAAVAVAASVFVAVRVNRPLAPTAVSPAPTVLATGLRVQGRPVVMTGGPGTSPVFLGVTTEVQTGNIVETDKASRAVLQTADASVIRIDRESRLRFAAPTVLELLAGAAYIETGPTSHGFEVRTAIGTVRDVGTRFEVRVTDSALRLRVRNGAVEIRRNNGVTAAAAGTEATVTTTGISMAHVPAYGAAWAWTAGLAPPYAIEGRTLQDFLEHTAAEEGWTLHYSNATVAKLAGATILHGSVDTLPPEDAVSVALATSGLQYRLREGVLLIATASDAR
jgi:ferric-dicitrate binding protein FerR (iron transport regulator)